MRAVIQRVSEARVLVDDKIVGAIESGLLVLLGATHGDSERDVAYLAKKITGLRVFEDDAGKMNLSLEQVGGRLLVVSQFTLYGDTRKGRRPAFVDAMEPQKASELVDHFVALARRTGCTVESGVFGAHMRVELVNDGPVTLILESVDGRGVRLGCPGE